MLLHQLKNPDVLQMVHVKQDRVAAGKFNRDVCNKKTTYTEEKNDSMSLNTEI